MVQLLLRHGAPINQDDVHGHRALPNQYKKDVRKLRDHYESGTTMRNVCVRLLR